MKEIWSSTPQKTKEILFTNGKDIPDPLKVTINDTSVECMDAYKYLGTSNNQQAEIS